MLSGLRKVELSVFVLGWDSNHSTAHNQQEKTTTQKATTKEKVMSDKGDRTFGRLSDRLTELEEENKKLKADLEKFHKEADDAQREIAAVGLITLFWVDKYTELHNGIKSLEKEPKKELLS